MFSLIKRDLYGNYVSFLLLVLLHSIPTSLTAQIFQNLDVTQCDSLIEANSTNPNFVILDVRRPSEYIPQHLLEAINRNYYDSDFTAQLDTLSKEKTYLIHCKSGGRSGNTINEMEALGFTEVYNMLGGINAWNNATLSTTTEFAPKIMFLSDSIHPLKEVFLGEVDTITLSITNRANDTLRFSNVSISPNPEFEIDIDVETSLTGAADYHFNVYYTPVDEIEDSAIVTIESNGGTLTAIIFRTGIDQTSGISMIDKSSNLNIYPNPAKDHIHISPNSHRMYDVNIFNISGQKLLEHNLNRNGNTIDLSGMEAGIYILSIVCKGELISEVFHIRP